MDDATDYRDWARRRVQAMLADGPAQRLVAVMVTSVDARAALEGKSGGLSSEPDKALLKAWRAAADAVLVGARTLETERYGSLIPDADRDARVAAGRTPWPRLLTISRRMDLDLDAVLSTDAALPLTIYTQATPPREIAGQDVQVVQLPDVSPSAVVGDARERYGYEVIDCEGGPHLLAVAIAEGVLTDLSLTLSPVVLGAGPPLLPGDDLPEAVPLHLAAAEAHAGSVFAHYRLD
jgi:riboflavin biosynthesis pyrimidine reductase